MAAHPEHPHLPEGREPGQQSRRNKRGTQVGSIVLLGFAVAFLVAAGLLFAGAFEDNDAPETTGLIFVGLAVFFALLALVIRRLRGPKRGLAHLTIDPGAAEYSRGQPLRARMRVNDASKMAAKTEVGLVCSERYDAEQGTGQHRQRTTREAVEWESWQPVDLAQPIQEFTFTLPADAPFSHEGDAISFAWRLSAREPRRARTDPRTDAPVWVNP